MSGEPGYMRWTPEQWRPVAIGALERLNPEGTNVAAALKHGQKRALTKDRWRDDAGLKRLAMPSNKSTQGYLKWAQSLTNDEKAKYLAPLPEKPKGVSQTGDEPVRYYVHAKSWTTRECVLLARRIRHWQVNMGDTRSLSSLFIAAQEIELPPDRRKSKQTIYASKNTGRLDQQFAEGRANEWTIEPASFDPRQTSYREPKTVDPATVQTATAAPEPASAPTSAATQAPAPTPQATPQTALGGPAAAFGAALAAALVPALTPALDALLAAHRRDVLAEVYGKLAAQGEALGATIANAVSADIVRGLRGVVHGMVESELGGPVAAPVDEAPAKPAAHNPEPAPPESPKSRLKIDIVGISSGGWEQQVKQAFNGLSDDFRFISPDMQSSYAPHRDRPVVMMTQRIPHALSRKIKASRAEVIQVPSTAGHVIHAIEALAQARGVPLAH